MEGEINQNTEQEKQKLELCKFEELIIESENELGNMSVDDVGSIGGLKKVLTILPLESCVFKLIFNYD
jgi:hypothetical protein